MSGGRTLGLALEVPEPLRSRVDAARAGFEPGAGRMPAHVTLVAPFDADEDALADIEGHCLRVAAAQAPFRLVVAGTATFRPVSPVAYLAIEEGAGECAALAAALATGPLAIPQRFAYHPHVTIAHVDDDTVLEAAMTAFAAERAAFDVREAVLWEHRAMGWVPVLRCPLGGQRAE